MKKNAKNDIPDQESLCSKQTNSFLELAEDICGIIKEPKDFSHNKKYLDGFGE